MAIKSVTKKAAIATVSKQAPARVVRVNKGNKAAAAKPAGTLFFFHKVPQGTTLRAYMLGLIMAQVGAIKHGAPFRVWPSANLHGHVSSTRLVKVEKDVYRMSAAGAEFFAESAEKLGKEAIGEMVKAVKSGVAPSSYNYKLSTMQKQ